MAEALKPCPFAAGEQLAWATATDESILAALTSDTLPALLAETRKKALEEAAKEAVSWAKTARKVARSATDPDVRLHQILAADMASDIAAAIRSLSNGEAQK